MAYETGYDHAVSYQISVGSRAKGYATLNSDEDYVLFVKSSRTKYLEYFTQLRPLQNHVRNKGTPDEYVESDLLFGLRGVYNGNYPHLFIFGNTANIPDRLLLEFIREIGNSRLKPILKHLVSFDYNSNTKKASTVTPKHQLQKLFNLSYVDYCLQNNQSPERDSSIFLPNLLPEEFKYVYESLMEKRMNAEEECSEEEIEVISNFQEKLRNRVLEMDQPEDDPEVLEKIIDIFLKSE